MGPNSYTPRARGVRGGCAENLAIQGQLFALGPMKETIMTKALSTRNVKRKFAEKNCHENRTLEPKAEAIGLNGLTT